MLQTNSNELRSQIKDVCPVTCFEERQIQQRIKKRGQRDRSDRGFPKKKQSNGSIPCSKTWVDGIGSARFSDGNKVVFVLPLELLQWRRFCIRPANGSLLSTQCYSHFIPDLLIFANCLMASGAKKFYGRNFYFFCADPSYRWSAMKTSVVGKVDSKERSFLLLESEVETFPLASKTR